MTDSATPATPAPALTLDPATAQGGAAPQKSPLDILEEILGEAAPAAGGSGAPAGTPDPAAPPAQTEPQLTVEEFEAMQAAQKAKDQEALQTQIAELSAITQTPAYQARVQQNSDALQQEEQAGLAGEGFEITQLGHTKIADEVVAVDAAAGPVAEEPVEPAETPLVTGEIPAEPTL